MRRHLHLSESSTKTLHATLLGALLGFVALFVPSMITPGVELRYPTTPLPIVGIFVSGLSFAGYAILGGLTIGGVLGYVYERYRTILPTVIVMVAYLVSIVWTGWRVHSWKQPPSGIREGFPPVLPWVTAFEYLVVGWPLLLVMAVGSGLLEHRLRTRGTP